MQTALTIAGSDSGGGAGIQADLKTFAAHGVYGTCAITAVTAQNTLGVDAAESLAVDLILAQIAAVAGDIGVDAVKTGMLATSAIVEAVAAQLPSLPTPHVVVDPVMVAKGGARLLADDAVQAVRHALIPRASVVTPNAMEAEVLTGITIDTLAAARDAARRIHDLGPATVVVKGGHVPTEDAVDVVFDGRDLVELRGPRLASRHTHGTGCTFAAAVAANLALGQTTADAVAGAKRYVTEAIRHGLPLGRGHGPLDHFHSWQR
ncbi:MAG: bifunctional hydroxymethylpyrimidine kinase/phosphomethylpyrimidine kinase [Vicinamibacterales bacterium]|jgi:hydroxymethylpyrimidine/phosphomethylpyrimidine kinase|nr:bifunctional hydroxymethylpyrimidine kinase/phosphomethylpyrimidine kinase [Acidobacteriota bacterium]MDP6372501.1 bifunctional hydroxymethylpyrimidine kinase/phosphomethylpyrimidine kinase [Vicinamibacterales bacterium]MDP6610463.1 bifunctional hydroxymethylpyrimidine kinase/phosphomethylpyrimidine kinase [Vicinamibacterales bacterium]HAK53872.1 bifunctional hydroxymethylpyrimidine kinase/phosphomethylpyrimidine kinase [Acidobacteriota bacterium]|tara:strand:+ start:4551 stop:5339 length:789 start_codon:yes stop_codon:yes gene_type:complete